MALGGWVLDKSAAARAGEPAVGKQLAELAGSLFVCPVGELEQLYSARSARHYEELKAELHAGFEVPQIRHSKIADSPVISFTTGQWSAWLTEITTDHLTNTNGAVTVIVSPDAWTVRCLDTAHTLVFDETEWTAFRLGATDGEFDPALSRELAST